jgi:hypothetical protein
MIRVPLGFYALTRHLPHTVKSPCLGLGAIGWFSRSSWGMGLGPQINSDPNAGGTRGGRVVHWQREPETSCLNYMKRLAAPIASLNI